MAKKQSPPPAGRRSTPRDKIKLPPPSGPSSSPSGQNGAGPDYYRLKKDAVEALVTANEENSPPVSAAELRKYRAGPRVTLADWAKALLLKAWTGGMVCYFFIWGLSVLSLNSWDHLLILGLVQGAVTNLITHNVFRFLAKTPGAFDRWMMVSRKEIWFLPLDLCYGLLLVVCVVMTYNGINLLASRFAGNTDSVLLGVEPLLYGLFILAWDLLFLAMKHLLQRIIRHAKQQIRKGG